MYDKSIDSLTAEERRRYHAWNIYRLVQGNVLQDIENNSEIKKRNLPHIEPNDENIKDILRIIDRVEKE